MRLLLSLLSFSLTLALHAQDTVPFGEARHFELDRRQGEQVLALGGFFQTAEPTFRYRQCLVTINGQVLKPEHSLSPTGIFAPRTTRDKPIPRFHEGTGALLMPLMHRSGGMADYDILQAREYDRSVDQFNTFPETIYVSLIDLVPADAKTIRVGFYNNAEGPSWSAGERVKPDLIVTHLALHQEKPDVDEFGPYVPPVWHVYDQHPWALAMASEKLRDADTPAAIKAEIEAQMGLLAWMTGDPERALRHYRRAISHGPIFPSYAEMCYRILRHTDTPPVASLPEPETAAGRWAALYNRMVAITAGQPTEGLIDIPYDDSPFIVDGQPDDPSWTARTTRWLPLSHQELGPAPATDAPPNEVAFSYDDEGLRMLFRGPGAPRLQLRDLPGEDRNAWEFNCAELFLNPRAEFYRYYELNCTAANGRYDSRYRWNRTLEPGPDFSAVWKSGAHTDADGLIVEYHVHWSTFGYDGPPPAGELWIANLIRVQFTPDEDGRLVNREFSLTDLLWRSFHRLQDGIIMRFEPR